MTNQSNQERGPVKMYTTRWCGDCFRAKSFLHAKGIEFEEIDIERDEEAMKVVVAVNAGRRRVPTLEIDGRYYGNPPIDELADVLGVPLW